MKNLVISLALIRVVVVVAAIQAADNSTASGSASSSAKPTDGFRQYNDNFKVQHPYDLKEADRFSQDQQVYTCWVNKTDKAFKEGSTTGARTEMRWAKNWTKDEHMWEGDIMFEPGTEHTCLMQIKSNTGGEAVYLQIENGDVYNDSDHKHVLLTDAAGKWFHVLSAYNPTAATARIWINGELKLTRHYERPLDTVWYFKNGVYNAAGSSKAHFKNLKFWEPTSAPPAAKQVNPIIPED